MFPFKFISQKLLGLGVIQTYKNRMFNVSSYTQKRNRYLDSDLDPKQIKTQWGIEIEPIAH